MSRDVKALAALFTASGIAHLVKPEPFESIVPKLLPNKRELVYISGMVELVCAALLVNPKTRQVGGLASAAIPDDPHCSSSGQVLTFAVGR